MEKRTKDILMLVVMVVILFIVNYSYLDEEVNIFLNTDIEISVNRIIDGDTIEFNNTSVRLLGINTPERGEVYYEEAKKFLEEQILNKTVVLKFGREKYDKYDRMLAYVFLDNENINKKIVENGFGNYYFPSGKDKYYSEFVNAWKSCVNNNLNLCEASTNSCVQCIILKDVNILINRCNSSCNITGWKIKAEGRNNTIFENTILESSEQVFFKLLLTETGDTIFLWDEKNKLVFWKQV